MKEQIIKKACKRMAAIMLAAALSMTGMPWLGLLSYEAYANEDEPATVTEAEALLQNAIDAKNEAQTEKDSAQTAYDEAANDYDAAVNDRQSKESAKDNAYSLYEAAQTTTATALSEMNAAEQTKNEAEAALTEATETLETRAQEESTAQNELSQAESDVEDAEEQWADEKAAAQQVLDAAQLVYDNAGYEFINEKVNELGSSYYSIDEIIEKEKTSTYGPKLAWNETDNLYIREVVSDSDFIKIVKDTCSYDNLKKGLEIMRRTNALRTAGRHGLNEIGVSYQLIANAVVSNSVTAYMRGHNLTSSSNYLYWTIDTPWSYRPRNENLAYSTRPMGSQYDPFDGLYYEERIVQLGKEAGGLTQAIINQVAAEAAADGSSYVPKSLAELSEEETTGHYLAIIEPELTAQGAAYSYTPIEYLNYMGYWKYRARTAQEFNNTTTNVITLTQYENELEDYFSDKKTAYENAKADVERLKTKPDYLQQAEATLAEKQTALDNASQAKADAETAKTNAENALSAAQTALNEKESAYNSAVTEEESKLSEYNEAVADFNAAVQTVNEKETAKNNAFTILEIKNSALEEAEAAVTAAQTVYNSFFKMENATISAIADQVFTGGTIEPGPEVKNKGGTVTLEAGTDYDVEYSNNTNAGTATVTVTGKGNYNGSNSKTFTIIPKALTEEMVGAIRYVVYDEKAQTPDVAVTDGEKTLTKGTDYTVEYSNNINVGYATAEIKGIGNYTGSVYRQFEIISRELAELQRLIEELEADKAGETDEQFITAIDEALEEARAAVNGTNVDVEYLSSIISSVTAKRTAAVSALEEKKKEAAKAAEAAKRAKQSGQGGAVGKGASIEFAEKSILASTSEEGPKGSKFAPLLLRSTRQANTSVTLTWTKVSNGKKYIIYGNACGKSKKMRKLATTTGKSYVVRKLANNKALNKGTYHKFMVVALDSKNNVISTSKVVHVATKGNKRVANPTRITLKTPKTVKKGKTHKLSAKQLGKYVKSHRALAYETSNAKVATVSKGVIKGVGKGTCYVYVYAQSGLYRKVKVTVK